MIGGPSFTNGSFVTVSSGLLDVSGSIYNQTAGSTTVFGGELKSDDFNITGGTITLSGGRYDFGSTNYNKLAQLNITSSQSQLAGEVRLDEGGLVDVTDIDVGSYGNTNGVVWSNYGTIRGSGTIQGSLNNQIDGELRVSGGDLTRFSTFNATHSNSGRIDVVGSSSNYAELEFEGQFVNQSDGLINVRNGVIRLDRELENFGQFSTALGNAEIYGDILNNGGTIGVGGNAEVALLGSLQQDGDMNLLGGSTLVVFDDYSGGGFSGTGSLEVLGTTSIGSSPGFETFGGNVTLGSSTLIELGGLGYDEYDRFTVLGTMNLGGRLDVEMWDNYLLQYNSEFLIADILGTRTGFFTGLSEGSLVGTWNNVGLFITYEAGSNQQGVALFTSVPEPSSAMLMLFGAVAWGIRRRRNEI